MHYRSTRICQRSLELGDFVAGVLKQLPSGFGFAADQLRRAASSVPLNYLEGCGRNGVADRRRFFHIAIGSAQEVAGALDVLHCRGALAAAECDRGVRMCEHIANMLRHFR